MTAQDGVATQSNESATTAQDGVAAYCSPPVDQWIQCPKCSKWYHRSCGPGDTATCYFVRKFSVGLDVFHGLGIITNILDKSQQCFILQKLCVSNNCVKI